MNKFIVGLFLTVFCVFGYASDCATFYPNNAAIIPVSSGEVCKSFFVVVYDSNVHHPLFSSQLYQPHSNSMVKRVGKFYDNPLDDIHTNQYPHGYDRGHLTPAADSINVVQMHDTFDIINSAPQVSLFNRGQWKELEEHVRKELINPTWIVTGLVWGDDIHIPINYYKVVYGSQITAYVGNNDQDGNVTIIDINELESKIGYKLH